MKTFLATLFLTLSASCFAQNVVVLTHGAANSEEFQRGFPADYPRSWKDIGDSTQLPEGFDPAWVVMTKAELDARLSQLDAAKELWYQVVGTREARKAQVGAVLQERIESGQWEPNRLRLHALESELFGKLIQGFRLNSELLLLVTKAVAGTAATNNLTAPERARVAAVRPMLSFASAPDLTQADRDRVMFITQELGKIEALWKAARDLRANIETNSAYVDPASLPVSVIGE